MRRVFIITTVLCVLLTGCGQDYNENNDVISEAEIMQESTEYEKTTISDVSKLQIVDTTSGIYAEDLHVDISDDYILRFQSVYENVTATDELSMREPLYSIELINADGSTADVWTIDEYRTIKTKDGMMLVREGEVDRLLTDIEEAYSLGYDLLARQPGDGYFSVLTKVNTAEFKKFNQINMDIPVEYSLSAKLVDSLKQNWQDIDISSVPVSDYKVIYTLNFYNSDGNSLQTWHIDENNRMYTSYGYELSGDFIVRWLDTVMSEALMN